MYNTRVQIARVSAITFSQFTIQPFSSTYALGPHRAHRVNQSNVNDVYNYYYYFSLCYSHKVYYTMAAADSTAGNGGYFVSQAGK